MNRKYLLYILTLFLGFVSCRNESDPTGVDPAEEDMLLIGAGTAELLQTRGAYDTDAEGNVIGGMFYLTYPTTESTIAKHQFQRLYVDFDNAVFSSKYQRYYAFTEGKESGSELTNALIGSVPNTLFLDNVAPVVSTAVNDTIVVFPADNPYVAGVMSVDNDILWGSENKHSTSNIYDFELHHVMAGVRVQITVDQSVELADDYDLSQAEVYITGIVPEAYSFSRVTGDVTIAAIPKYTDLYLVNNLEGSSTGEEIDWAIITTETPDDDENPGNPVFITQNFILPPQAPSEENWPELVVRFPNPSPEEVEAGKTYKEFFGKLPRGMFTNYTTGTNYGLELAFLREHILEIRTQISNTPPQLVFMPVKVYDWVEFGPYTLIGHQEGIYSGDDLMEIIDYYNTNNTAMLKRFGMLQTVNDNEVWYFNIFSNITVDLDQVSSSIDTTGKANGIYFNLNGYKVRVRGSDGTIQYTITSSQQFMNLLIDGQTPPPPTTD